MCRAVTCKKCGKASWKGCGAHVEQDVPPSQRCHCSEVTVHTAKCKSWFSR